MQTTATILEALAHLGSADVYLRLSPAVYPRAALTAAVEELRDPRIRVLEADGVPALRINASHPNARQVVGTLLSRVLELSVRADE